MTPHEPSRAASRWSTAAVVAAAWVLGERLAPAQLIGGAVTVAFVIALAYYSTMAAWRFDVDPDTYGIPVVTASVDFVGVLILIVTMYALGIA